MICHVKLEVPFECSSHVTSVNSKGPLLNIRQQRIILEEQIMTGKLFSFPHSISGHKQGTQWFIVLVCFKLFILSCVQSLIFFILLLSALITDFKISPRGSLSLV